MIFQLTSLKIYRYSTSTSERIAMSRLKKFCVALVLAFAICFTTSSSADAATKPVVIEKGRHYTVYKFNAQQTKSVANGATVAAILFGAGKSWVVVPTGITAWWTQRMVDRGQCLYVRVGTWPKAWGGTC